MLDVHAPHGRLHGFKEFSFHLLTITVGLLIATQIEACVEWRHHVHLASEVREALREEIEHNLSSLKAAQPGLAAWHKTIDDDLAAVQQIESHPNDPKAQHTSLNVTSAGITLDSAAWRTAQATGALAYMPYSEAQRFSAIYDAQAQLMAYQEKPADDVSTILGIMERLNLNQPGKKISAVEAGELAEPIGRMRVHLARGSTMMEMSIELCQAYLEGREPKGNFSFDLKY